MYACSIGLGVITFASHQTPFPSYAKDGFAKGPRFNSAIEYCFFCTSAFDEYCFYLYVCVFSIITFCSALFSHSSIILSPIDKSCVFFVCWFWAPFFEQVVFALGMLFVTSLGDVSPVVKRHFRLFN